MNSLAYDLAIIGGGPAGCAAAIRAADFGLRTVLFEARLYPHDKLCGEFLSPECRGMLSGLGAEASIWKLHPQPITHACLTAPDGFAWETTLPGTAWGVSRKNLDAALADRAVAAGAVLQTGTTVEQARGSLEEGFTLAARSASGRFNATARAVIAAHGKRSILDRALNRKFLQRRQPFVAFKAHFTGIHMPGQVELHAFPGGYCGFSMIEDDYAPGPVTNVCFLARAEVFQGARRSGQKPLDSFLDWMRTQNPHLHDRLRQGRQLDRDWISIAQVPFTPKSLLEGDLLTAGDAAGLIAPLAGNGISMALRSGMLAAGLVFGYLDQNRSPAWLLQTYAHAWKQAFGGRLALGRLLQSLILRPGLTSASLHLVHLVPPLGQYFLNHTREAHPYVDE